MKITFALLATLAATISLAAAQDKPQVSSASRPDRRTTNEKTKPAKAGNKMVVSPGGQGHNSGADPKGKILVAPTTKPASPK